MKMKRSCHIPVGWHFILNQGSAPGFSMRSEWNKGDILANTIHKWQYKGRNDFYFTRDIITSHQIINPSKRVRIKIWGRISNKFFIVFSHSGSQTRTLISWLHFYLDWYITTFLCTPAPTVTAHQVCSTRQIGGEAKFRTHGYIALRPVSLVINMSAWV